mmetsp:Transcript_49286/g.123529  ORF Transcript_49286/g.123529 Transcript_49286/m.123529 type:complete len:254 (+) Transcript_49286:2318-3079(+)
MGGGIHPSIQVCICVKPCTPHEHETRFLHTHPPPMQPSPSLHHHSAARQDLAKQHVLDLTHNIPQRHQEGQALYPRELEQLQRIRAVPHRLLGDLHHHRRTEALRPTRLEPLIHAAAGCLAVHAPHHRRRSVGCGRLVRPEWGAVEVEANALIAVGVAVEQPTDDKWEGVGGGGVGILAAGGRDGADGQRGGVIDPARLGADGEGVALHQTDGPFSAQRGPALCGGRGQHRQPLHVHPDPVVEAVGHAQHQHD